MNRTKLIGILVLAQRAKGLGCAVVNINDKPAK
jgi:hypothetical protein